MNALERSYSQQLDVLVRLGRVAEWHYEAVTLRIGADCRLTPDFLVVLSDGTVEFHDTKGTTYRHRKAGRVGVPYIQEDARVKLRAAATAFPFTFKLVTHTKAEGWHTEEVPA